MLLRMFRSFGRAPAENATPGENDDSPIAVAKRLERAHDAAPIDAHLEIAYGGMKIGDRDGDTHADPGRDAHPDSDTRTEDGNRCDRPEAKSEPADTSPVGSTNNFRCAITLNAGRKGEVLPQYAHQLRSAARSFDDVYYGGREAQHSAYLFMVGIDDEHRRQARPISEADSRLKSVQRLAPKNSTRFISAASDL